VSSRPADISPWRSFLPWLATAGRLLLGGVWIAAGWGKATDLAASVRAVRAYELLPEGLAQVVGAGLPFVEIALGALLVAGVATRISALVSAVLLAAFMIGIASAWARGLRIDCGCFGSGGSLGAGKEPTYGWELLRDGGLILVAALLALRPASKWSIDQWIAGPETDIADAADGAVPGIADQDQNDPSRSTRTRRVKERK
jgi:uncharacterized membrane protein YphA (DoxX/SURF4 family)